ncbi:MAG: ABC transporter ATP-binding protein [Lachnospiraceae bacterium]|nr:ABC transporter ATP-binding protein [Lachnospiraceae bacterium]
MNILEMKQIGKKFSGVYANEAVDLSVKKGEIHALLGENGAGKTTLMNILFGIYAADEGEIFWKGEKVQFHSPKDAIAEGIGMVHQHFSLVNKMTVLDNVTLGLGKQGVFLDRKGAKRKLEELAEKYGLSVDPDAKISELSVGQQQRVEILKALYRNVELLILDEPTGVLTPQETEQFFEVLRKLKREGYAVIIITHRMSEIMSISDRVTILRDGRKITDLVTKETNPTELSNYMIGRQLDYDFEVKETGQKETALLLQNVTVRKSHKKPALDRINLEVYKGEILGIAGVDGNGQKELAEVIAGIRKMTEGNLTFYGEEIAAKNIKERFDRGISYISDDRHQDGLVLDMNVEENLILRQYDRRPYLKGGIFQRNVIRENAAKAIEKYRIKTSGTSAGDTQVKLMSGGNQQKIVLAREITEQSKLIIASQPTRGLDIGATQFVRQVLMEQRNEGKSVILISADLEEIMQLSDRVAVMFGGKIVGILKKEEAEMEKIGLLMGGITKEEAN